MKDVLNLKFVKITPPGAIIDNAAAVTATLDTLGMGWVTIVVHFGAMDIAVSVMKLTESDDSGMSGAADVPSADFSVLPATLPSATDDNHFFAIHVPMLGRKRYLDLSLTLGDGSAGTYVTVFAVCADLAQAPYGAAARGFTQELFAG